MQQSVQRKMQHTMQHTMQHELKKKHAEQFVGKTLIQHNHNRNKETPATSRFHTATTTENDLWVCGL